MPRHQPHPNCYKCPLRQPPSLFTASPKPSLTYPSQTSILKLQKSAMQSRTSNHRTKNYAVSRMREIKTVQTRWKKIGTSLGGWKKGFCCWEKRWRGEGITGVRMRWERRMAMMPRWGMQKRRLHLERTSAERAHTPQEEESGMRSWQEDWGSRWKKTGKKKKTVCIFDWRLGTCGLYHSRVSPEASQESLVNTVKDQVSHARSTLGGASQSY